MSTSIRLVHVRNPLPRVDRSHLFRYRDQNRHTRHTEQHEEREADIPVPQRSRPLVHLGPMSTFLLRTRPLSQESLHDPALVQLEYLAVEEGLEVGVLAEAEAEVVGPRPGHGDRDVVLAHVVRVQSRADVYVLRIMGQFPEVYKVS